MKLDSKNPLVWEKHSQDCRPQQYVQAAAFIPKGATSFKLSSALQKVILWNDMSRGNKRTSSAGREYTPAALKGVYLEDHRNLTHQSYKFITS
ncbi:UNVERIFIED_CONTAM: hypothetical protein NCL1_32053 [Trichonephila clavipes]